MRDLRIGLGFDAHALVDGRQLILGGVTFEGERGLAGHSDADVVTHALMDAIVSAMRAGDIGALFPDDDPAYAGADSIGLLARVGERMREAGYTLIDADIVVVLERPRIAPRRDEMRARMASALDVPIEAIGLKATTTERLGFTGREEGIAAYAVALLEKRDDRG